MAGRSCPLVKKDQHEHTVPLLTQRQCIQEPWDPKNQATAGRKDWHRVHSVVAVLMPQISTWWDEKPQPADFKKLFSNDCHLFWSPMSSMILSVICRHAEGENTAKPLLHVLQVVLFLQLVILRTGYLLPLLQASLTSPHHHCTQISQIQTNLPQATSPAQSQWGHLSHLLEWRSHQDQ